MAHWMGAAQWNRHSPWFRTGLSSGAAHNAHMPYIDQQTRKALPAWIREGLEKAEQEKQKKLLKEAKLRAAEEARKARREAKGLGKFVSLIVALRRNDLFLESGLKRGGRYWICDVAQSQNRDSDSSEDESGNEIDRNGSVVDDGEPVFLQMKKETDANDRDKELTEADFRTEEEKREDALALLRRFMTEVLMVTTDAELERICGEQLENALRKAVLLFVCVMQMMCLAQPKILAKSSALAALSALGAESDSDDSEGGNGETTRRSSGAETDDESGGRWRGGREQAEITVGAKSKARLNVHDGRNFPQHSPLTGEVVAREEEEREEASKSGTGVAALEAQTRSCDSRSDNFVQVEDKKRALGQSSEEKFGHEVQSVKGDQDEDLEVLLVRQPDQIRMKTVREVVRARQSHGHQSGIEGDREAAGRVAGRKTTTVHVPTHMLHAGECLELGYLFTEHIFRF
ncbi:unnamed protein product [Toxocara canis]|uniref:DEAD/DEAH box helicase domain-containing protein n=1 Tax=Toxocara canis TaxID=6265 RepID=A0A183UIR0_TOXCA|nr:unnamed protein product [Toxocara canis]